MFYSIMFPEKEQHLQKRRSDMPDCFRDINLDQIFAPIIGSRKGLRLEEFFYTPLSDRKIIYYRQDVMRELENDALYGLIAHFSDAINILDNRMSVIDKLLNSEYAYDNNYLTKGKMLDCADIYRKEVTALGDRLNGLNLRSQGLCRFSEYLSEYRESDFFKSFSKRVVRLREDLSKVQYCMLIKNGTIRVRKYEDQADLSKQIIEKFEKFRQGDVKDYRHKLSEEPHAEHVEAAVLKMVSLHYKDIFEDLDDFCVKYLNFRDDTILRFSREIQFYISWLECIRPLRKAGLSFNYPKLCGWAERIYNCGGFDLALALKKQSDTVTNDFELNMPERIIVVTGPNQGGKTTFARAFGQMHWLASLGLSVPGSESALQLFDNVLTHFGREEDLSALSGKLQDDLLRLRELLDKATERSVIVINEIFSSTTLSDALLLGGRMMDALAKLGAPAVVVTFLDELACHGEETVSMMSTVREDAPSQRTFKIIRKPPDGLAYAMHIAGRHGLTYEQLSGRLKR